jgi:DNA-binding transcriptional LysR family regulator
MHSTALRYFLEVARSGSIADASKRLNVAASAISRQIAKLERELGAELFERRPRGMVPSAAGEILAGHARRAMLDGERAAAEIRELQGPHRGHVRLASFEGFAIDILSAAVAAFRRGHPGVTFHLWVGTSPEIADRVQDGETDIGITFNLAPPRGTAVERMIRRPMHALVPSTHPLAGRESLTLADTLPYPVALPDPDRTQRQLIDAACNLQGLRLDPVLSTNSMAALRRFSDIEGCLHFTSAIRDPGRVEMEDFVAVPVADQSMTDSTLHILTMAGRTLPAAVRAFRDALLSDLAPVERS